MSLSLMGLMLHFGLLVAVVHEKISGGTEHQDLGAN
jgi:hypothetical protein